LCFLGSRGSWSSNQEEPLSKTQRRNQKKNVQRKQATLERQKEQERRLYQHRMEQMREQDKMKKKKFIGSIAGEIMSGGYKWGSGSGSGSGSGAKASSSSGPKQDMPTAWSSKSSNALSGNVATQNQSLRNIMQMEESKKCKAKERNTKSTLIHEKNQKSSMQINSMISCVNSDDSSRSDEDGWTIVQKGSSNHGGSKKLDDQSQTQNADPKVKKSTDLGSKSVWGQ